LQLLIILYWLGSPIYQYGQAQQADFAEQKQRHENLVEPKNVGKFFWLLFFPRKVTRFSPYSAS